MKTFLMIAAAICLAVAAAQAATTHEIATNMQNTGFDTAITTWDGGNSSLSWRAVGNESTSTHYWGAGGDGGNYASYVVFTDPTVVNSSPYAVAFDLYNGGFRIIGQAINGIDLIQGDTYEVAFKLRTVPNQTSTIPALAVGIYKNGELGKTTLDLSLVNATWQTYTWSYTHTAATVTGSWDLNLWATASGSHSELLVDTFGVVPEPVSLSLLLLGAGGMLGGRRRK
jgi:hypothetical protein